MMVTNEDIIAIHVLRTPMGVMPPWAALARKRRTSVLRYAFMGLPFQGLC